MCQILLEGNKNRYFYTESSLFMKKIIKIIQSAKIFVFYTIQITCINRRAGCSLSKVINCFFLDQWDFVWYDLLKPEKTIHGKCFSIVMDCLDTKRTIWGPDLSTRRKSIIFYGDNGWPNCAVLIKIYTENFWSESSPHPPYSSSLASFGYPSFLSIDDSRSNLRLRAAKEIITIIDLFLVVVQLKFSGRYLKFSKMIGKCFDFH